MQIYFEYLCWDSCCNAGHSSRNTDNDVKEVKIMISSASLQGFSKEEWSFQQQYKINTTSKLFA
ncbi:hypothetical protein LXL04_009640 [Taraxacum kok-saghyz]